MLKKYISFILLLLLVTLPAQATSRSITCLAVSITDGDTFTCLLENNKQIKIRLAEIDAPEKKQPFGKKSKQALARYIHKKKVKLVIFGYDRYQRTLATVYDQNDENINLKMVQSGMAWAYKKYVRNPVYIQAQQNAKRKEVGLWQDKNPIPPEQWRKQQRLLHENQYYAL